MDRADDDDLLQRNSNSSLASGNLLRTFSQKLRSLAMPGERDCKGNQPQHKNVGAAFSAFRWHSRRGAEKQQRPQQVEDKTAADRLPGCFDFEALKFRRSMSLSKQAAADRIGAPAAERPRSSICMVSGGCFSAQISDDQEGPGTEELHHRQATPAAAAIPRSGWGHLPDEIVEAILAKASFSTLVRARAVCKRWRDLTLSQHFVELRKTYRASGAAGEPWLLLFGLSRDGVSGGSIQALDPAAGGWRSVPAAALEGRLLYSAAAAGSMVYVAGGCSAGSPSVAAAATKTHRSVLGLDLTMGRWTKLAPMRAARVAPIAAAFDVRRRRRDRHSQELVAVLHGLLVVGGQGEWNEPLRSGEIYDPETNTWRDMEAWPPGMGSLCSGVVYAGSFYGYSDADKLAAYDLDDSAVGCWRTIVVSYVPQRLHDYLPRLVACDDGLVLVGVAWGAQGRAARKLWRLDRAERRWAEVSQHPDAPLDWTAVFVGDGNRVYGVEMFKMFGQVLDFVTAARLSGGDGGGDEGTKTRWERISRERMGRDVDASSCLTKTAVVVRL